MSFTAPIMTTAGRTLQARVNAGETRLRFTRIVMGSGDLGAQTIEALTNVIASKADITISSVTRADQTVTAKCFFNNAETQTGFYWKEVGLFAENPNDPNNRAADILYCYQNAGALAEYIPSASSAYIEKTISIATTISSTATVVIGITPGSYVDVETFMSHVDDHNNPHEVTAEQVGAAPTVHTHTAATQSTAGFMSAADKQKLDGIAAGANNYTLPDATTQAKGGVKVGTGINVSSGTISVKYGTASDTACRGDDARLSDARTPKPHNHDDLYLSKASGGTIQNAQPTTRAVRNSALYAVDTYPTVNGEISWIYE